MNYDTFYAVFFCPIITTPHQHSYCILVEDPWYNWKYGSRFFQHQSQCEDDEVYQPPLGKNMKYCSIQLVWQNKCYVKMYAY